jgi:hypothetical protein
MKAQLYTLNLQFRRPDGVLPTVKAQYQEMFEFARMLAPRSARFRDWYLSWSTSKEDALTYRAFDQAGPSADALAILQEQSQGVDDIRIISVWNGLPKGDGVVIRSNASVLGMPDRVSLSTKDFPVDSWQEVAAWLEASLRIWPASFASVEPFFYAEVAVFRDRPGVGWMLFLPQVITVSQVPEARALVPVNDSRGVQRGTLIVSVTDEPFCLENKEHIAIANAIEVRLADLELLPRYLEL